ncbi:MAG: hypothetical protein ACI4A5_01240 [Hominilimicola sp.]
MAEFCKECFMEICDVDLKKEKIITSKDLDLCETCGEWKHVVVKVVDRNPIKRLIKEIDLKWYLYRIHH